MVKGIIWEDSDEGLRQICVKWWDKCKTKNEAKNRQAFRSALEEARDYGMPYLNDLEKKSIFKEIKDLEEKLK